MLILVVTVWGHVISREQASQSAFDVLVGIAAVFASLIHSIVYTYFIATSKFVERAVEEHGYPDPAAIDRSKLNKRKAFRYGFLAILFAMFAAFLYFWSSPVRQEEAVWRGWASIGAWLAFLINLYAARREWEYVVKNCVITDDILRKVEGARKGEAE